MALTDYDDDFKGAKPSASGPIPDGRYVATLVALKQDVSKSGNPMIVWTLKIAEGEHAGRTIKKYSTVKTGKPMDFLKGDMKKFDLEEITLSDFPNHFLSLLHSVLSIHVNNRNVFFGTVKRLGAPPAPPETDAPF